MDNQSKESSSMTKDSKDSNFQLREIYADLIHQFGDNWHRHVSLGVHSYSLARILYYTELYKHIVNVPGVICEFGVQWGATMANLINLRSIYEPYNISRKIIGFDTFEGFPSVSEQDGQKGWAIGDYASKLNYESELNKILNLHEFVAPMNHIQKFELVKGDICSTFPKWLEQNQHAVVSMAIFDTDLYAPTRDVLNLIKPRLVKGSLLVFDEFNCEQFPGETVAVREVLGTENLRFRRSNLQPFCSWAIWGE